MIPAVPRKKGLRGTSPSHVILRALDELLRFVPSVKSFAALARVALFEIVILRMMNEAPA